METGKYGNNPEEALDQFINFRFTNAFPNQDVTIQKERNTDTDRPIYTVTARLNYPVEDISPMSQVLMAPIARMFHPRSEVLDPELSLSELPFSPSKISHTAALVTRGARLTTKPKSILVGTYEVSKDVTIEQVIDRVVAWEENRGTLTRENPRIENSKQITR